MDHGFRHTFLTNQAAFGVHLDVVILYSVSLLSQTTERCVDQHLFVVFKTSRNEWLFTLPRYLNDLVQGSVKRPNIGGTQSTTAGGSGLTITYQKCSCESLLASVLLSDVNCNEKEVVILEPLRRVINTLNSYVSQLNGTSTGYIQKQRHAACFHDARQHD